MRIHEPVRESLAYRIVPGYLESLMDEGRIGNKLDLLGLTKPETLLKVGMSQVLEWWGIGYRACRSIYRPQIHSHRRPETYS